MANHLRILFCGYNYAPETMGCARYTVRTANALRGLGHEVRAIAAVPHFPQHRVWEGFNPRGWSGDFNHGQTVHCPTGLRSTRGFLRRFAASAVFGATCQRPLRQAVAWKPDIIWTVAPTLACAPAVLDFARRAGAVSWLHVQDFESGALRALSSWPRFVSGHLANMAERFEKRLMQRFDLVSTIAPHMMQRLENTGLPVNRLYLFPNPADEACLAPLDTLRSLGDAYRKKWGFPQSARIVLYAGTMGRKQGGELLHDVGRRLAKEKVVLLAVGSGPEFDRHRSGQRSGQRSGSSYPQTDYGLRFLPTVPDQELPALLAMADLHLVMLRPGADSFCHPSRLANILAAGGSLVVASQPDGPLHHWTDTLPHSAVHCSCESTQAMSLAILEALNSLPRRNPHSRQAALNTANPRRIFPELEQRLLQVARSSTWQFWQ
ncbi:MAG: WcaI family glycosyltransferase [Desulfovibrio sp.]|uniref:WcaI family glycosyltransferase n=1 Tax=Desulfovibrio sp. 7SRBS1 TaxID=3378064 RepID=UPI003B3E47DC